MITYMDHTVGSIIKKLKEHNLQRKTLVLFTGDNGTNKSITSQLNGIQIQGGKGSMTEAGTRVPLIAWWPGQITPVVRDEFFCLIDVLPTIHSIANIELNRKVDGYNLAHCLIGGQGIDRETVSINFGQGFFVRDRRFRLNQNGNLYDIPIDSDETRYSEFIAAESDHSEDRKRLQSILDQFMSIKPITE